MNKLDEIKAFIEKKAKVMAELAQAAKITYYSQVVSDEIIEQQQDLMRHGRRLHIVSIEQPFFDEAEFEVLIGFSEFSRFIDLEECQVKAHTKEDYIAYQYSIIIDNLLLKSIKIVNNEEHKKAQAI
ncbi:hypothetical protein [Solibacillus sp.]|uniref:hypothetical protein n=1 Tax=Solibacillus sp. TaxID=1909654 RepID=UPI003316258C